MNRRGTQGRFAYTRLGAEKARLSQERKKPRRLGRAVREWVLQNPIPTMTAVGLGVYGILRFSYDLFYSRFGVAPEEVGLGYAEMLARSLLTIAMTLALIGLASLAYVLFLSIPYWIGMQLRRFVSRTWQRVTIALGAAGLAFWQISSGPPSWFTFVVLVALIVCTALVLPGVEGEGGIFKSSVRTGRGDLRRILAWVVLVGVLALTPTVLLLMTTGAVETADAVRRGVAQQGVGIFGIRLLPLPATKATLTLAQRDTPSPSSPYVSPCLMYLGQANGTAVFYDRDEERTIRLPTANLVISTGASCS